MKTEQTNPDTPKLHWGCNGCGATWEGLTSEGLVHKPDCPQDAVGFSDPVQNDLIH